MSSPSNAFECRWHASRQLLAAYLLAQLFALGSLLLLSIPLWASLLGAFCCLAHGVWALPRQILLTHAQAFRGLRRDADGWQLWSEAQGWQPVQLRPDSLALPLVVVLRFRLRGERCARAICVPRDSQAADVHRRLRVRLKFSRRRWAAPE
ncbi:protein YgfX [Pseudomonas sp. A-RE-19]|uniref:protein YgfX n=1 Tax=Pseudomonas sp. A-RE-19 TaxID=2832401 RepID=UPI001CBFF67D|nr:protein YgfX [Pseudomonas sp. A-RE-19]